MKLKAIHIALTALTALTVLSCSTTRVIPEGQSRLKNNKVIVTNDRKFQTSTLYPYIKQKPNSYYLFGWNPFINIYNWSNGKEDGWDRFVKKLGVEPVIFDSTLVESSRNNILNHLEYIGYYGSRVTDSVVTKKKKTTVYYNVELGRRFVIKDLSYVVDNRNMEKIVSRRTKHPLVKKGDYLSEEMLTKESERLTNIIRRRGYFAFDSKYFYFEADTTQVRDSALLKIYIRNFRRGEDPMDSVVHRKYKVRNVNIISTPNLSEYGIYSDLTEIAHLDTMQIGEGTNLIYFEKPLMRPKAIANANRIRSGEVYNESVIKSTYDRFSDMRYFSSVNIQMDEADSSQVDCTIRLRPSKPQGYKLNFETSINSTGLFGISPAVSYYNKNIFRGGEWFDLSLMGNFQFKFNNPIRSNEFGISASLSLPQFLLLPNRLFTQTLPRTEISLSYNYQNRPEYTRNILSASYGYQWNIDRKFYYWINPLQINIVKLFNLSNEFYESLKDPYLRNSYQDHFDFGLGTTFYYTTNPATNPKNTYFYVRWQNDLAGNFLSIFNHAMEKSPSGNRLIWGTPYSQYYRTEISAVQTWFFGDRVRQSLAVRFMGGIGIAYGNSSALPFEKLFWSGGANSLRGWAAKSIGPGMAPKDESFSIPNQTGDIKLEANIEYRFPIAWKFAGGLFIDAGNVWSLSTGGNDTISELGQLKASTFFRSIALSYGFGLRLDLDFVLMRIDLGFVGFDPSRQQWISPSKWFGRDNFALQFGIGYPF